MMTIITFLSANFFLKWKSYTKNNKNKLIF